PEKKYPRSLGGRPSWGHHVGATDIGTTENLAVRVHIFDRRGRVHKSGICHLDPRIWRVDTLRFKAWFARGLGGGSLKCFTLAVRGGTPISFLQIKHMEHGIYVLR